MGAVSFSVSGKTDAQLIADVKDLKARLGKTMSSWGYTFPAADGSGDRVVVVFKPLRKEKYNSVLNHWSPSLEVWSVEKFSPSRTQHTLPKPLWVLAKSKSKATLNSCTSGLMNARQEKDDAKDEADIKETKMYKKYSEMTKKKLMKLMKKYQEKIAIAKKALKAMKKDKEN